MVSKSLEFPSHRTVFHGGPWQFMLIRCQGRLLDNLCLEDGPGWELTTAVTPTMWLESWGFEPHDISPTSRKGKGLEIEPCGWWVNQSCLCNKTPIKTLDNETCVSCSDLQYSLCCQYQFSGRVLHRGRITKVSQICDPPRPCPMHFFFRLALILSFCYNKTIR